MIKSLRQPSPLINMLTYGIGLVISKGAALIMLPIIANYLAPSQIGRLDLLASIGAVAGIVVTFALHEALYRFVGEESDFKKRFLKASEIFSLTCVVSLILAAVLFGYINSGLGDQFAFASRTELNLILICASLEGVIGLSTAWLRMQDKAFTFLAISVASTLLQISLILGVLFSSPSVEKILMCGVVTYLFQITALLIINRLKLTFTNISAFRKYLRYGWPLMLTGLIGFGLNGAERFFVAYSTNLDTLGQYAIAIKFSFAMCILVQPFGMWWMPKRFNTLANQGRLKTVEVTQLGIIYITLLTVGVAFAAKAFILLALPETYLLSAQLVLGTLLFSWFKEVAELLNIGILHRKATRLQLWISVSATLIGLSMMWLLSGFGVWGIIGALCIAQAFKAVVVFIYSQRLTHLPYSLGLFLFEFNVLVLCLLLALSIQNVWFCLAMAVIAPVICCLPAYRIEAVRHNVQALGQKLIGKLGILAGHKPC